MGIIGSTASSILSLLWGISIGILCILLIVIAPSEDESFLTKRTNIALAILAFVSIISIAFPILGFAGI